MPRSQNQECAGNSWARALAAAIGLASALAPSLADAGNTPGAAVGAIRWDLWVGDRHPYGLELEYTLGPSKWHDRLPFYAVRTGPDTVQVRQLTQAQMDQDIAYANRAGLDYWAFCWYPEGSSFDIARNLYKSSTQRGNLKFAYIIGVSDYPAGSVESIVADLGKSYYQRVLNGRPLVYVFETAPKTQDFLARLRQSAAAAGMPAPYVVLMHYDSATAASGAGLLGADAISAYMTGPWDGVPYSSVISENQSRWNAHAATGRKVIPWVTVGLDNRPRNERPASFVNPVPPPNAWAQQATAAEVATNLQNALNWIASNPTSSDANAVLMYAWNEFDEGGWLTPTLDKGTDRIEAVSEVLRYSSSSNWDSSMTANKAFDGSPWTAWQAAPHLFAGQWIEVDFGRDTTFSQATMREYGDRTRGYRIEYLNGTTWRTAYTGTAIGASSTIGFAPVTGRKARLYFTSGVDTPIIYEWSLNGAPSQQANLALHESYSSSSNWDSNQTADKAFDGDPNTNWQGRGASFAGTWLAVDFGVRTAFNTMTLSEYGDRTSGYRIEYWNGSGWSTAHTGTTIGASTTVTFPTVVASQARIYFTAGWSSPIIYEASISLAIPQRPGASVFETRQSLPAMSGDSAPAGHVSTASSAWDGNHLAFMAFDQSTTNFSWGSIWASNGGPFPQWVQRRLSVIGIV